jgi:hypothetical protein
MPVAKLEEDNGERKGSITSEFHFKDMDIIVNKLLFYYHITMYGILDTLKDTFCKFKRAYTLQESRVVRIRRMETITNNILSSVVFRVVTPCSLVGGYHSFGGTYGLILQD